MEMAKNQQQQSNIKEQIFETVTTIVDDSIKDLGYNITKICKIIDDSEKDRHKYKVECGSLKMNVVDDNRTPGGYSNDQIVRVTIPNGNYNAKKVIEGLYSAGNEEDTIYVQPRNHFVSMTDPYSIMDDYFPIDISNQEESTPQPIFSTASTDDFNFKDTEIFNSIYLKFTHLYEAKRNNNTVKLISGTFQVDLQLSFSDDKKDKTLSFSSVQFVGDPYSSMGFVNDIMFNCGDLSGLQYVDFFAFIPEAEKNSFIDIEGNKISEGQIKLNNISIEFGHQYIDQKGLKLYTDDSLDYGREAGDYIKHLKYIWYNVDENDNFLGFERGNFNTDFDFETIIKNKQLNEIYQNILDNNSEAKDNYGDAAGLDLRFNYDEIIKLQPGFLSATNSLKNQINQLSIDFQKQWWYTSTDTEKTKLNMWLSENQSNYGGNYINFWLTQAQDGVGQILQQWNWEMAEGQGYGNLIKKLNAINKTFFDSQSIKKNINSIQRLSIKGATDKGTSSTLHMPELDSDANSYFQISHILRGSDIIPGQIIIADSPGDDEVWLPANDILQKMRTAIYDMKRGVLLYIMGTTEDDEQVVNKLWTSQTFTAYDKTEYIKSYFEPINDQEKRISFLENQIDIFNQKVKIYKRLREFLLKKEHMIDDKDNNLCILLSKDFTAACDESKKIFDGTPSDQINQDLMVLNLGLDITKNSYNKYIDWFNDWKDVLQSFMSVGLDLKTEYDSRYSVPESDTYKIYVANGIGILSSIKSIQNYIDLFTNLGFTSKSESPTFKEKYGDWRDTSNKTKWTPYPVEIEKNSLDIKFFQTNDEKTDINPWLGEAGWEEINLVDEKYWPIKKDNNNIIKYLATRYSPITIGLKRDLTEEISYSINASKKEKQSFQIVILYNDQIIKSNILTFNNYSNYNVFSQIPYLKISTIDSNDFALSSKKEDDLIKYQIVGYEKDKNSVETALYRYTSNYYPKLKVSYGAYGIATEASDKLLQCQTWGEADKISTIGVGLKTKRLLPLENYIFSIVCLSVFYEDDIEHRMTIPVPLATYSDLEMDGPKMIVFKQNGEVVFDRDSSYTVFSKSRMVDEKSLNYSIILMDRNNGTVQPANNYMYVDENQKLQILTDYNTLVSYLPILEVTGFCKATGETEFEYFVYRHPLLFTTDKSLKENYSISNLSTIISQNQNNIHGSSVFGEEGIINFSHSYIPPEKSNISSSTYLMRSAKNTNNSAIKKGISELKSTFPYFTFFSDSLNGLFEINLENEAPLRIMKDENGIEFYYDGTIKLLKKDLEPLIFNYDTLNKLQKILDGSDVK